MGHMNYLFWLKSNFIAASLESVVFPKEHRKSESKIEWPSQWLDTSSLELFLQNKNKTNKKSNQNQTDKQTKNTTPKYCLLSSAWFSCLKDSSVLLQALSYTLRRSVKYGHGRSTAKWIKLWCLGKYLEETHKTVGLKIRKQTKCLQQLQYYKLNSQVCPIISQISSNSLPRGDTQHPLEDLTGTILALCQVFVFGNIKTQAAVSLSSVVWKALWVRLGWKLFWPPLMKTKHRKSYYSTTPQKSPRHFLCWNTMSRWAWTSVLAWVPNISDCLSKMGHTSTFDRRTTEPC